MALKGDIDRQIPSLFKEILNDLDSPIIQYSNNAAPYLYCLRAVNNTTHVALFACTWAVL